MYLAAKLRCRVIRDEAMGSTVPLTTVTFDASTLPPRHSMLAQHTKVYLKYIANSENIVMVFHGSTSSRRSAKLGAALYGHYTIYWINQCMMNLRSLIFYLF